MEYIQDEINEPINIDILLEYFPPEICNRSNVTIIYRDLFESHDFTISNYDIILISSKISSYRELCQILKLCKDKIVIVGGILAICAYSELALSYQDVVFNTGEGETNINNLLRLAFESSNVNTFKKLILEYNISNVCFYDKINKKVFCSKRLICNLKVQPFPKHNRLNYAIANNGLVRMETSRGCPWNKCSFCIMPWRFCGEAWRSFSNEKIEKEIKYLIQHNVKRILFTDEDFVANRQHISNLCEIISRCTSECNHSVTFGGSTSVLTLLNLGNDLDSFLQEMYNIGISYLFIGVESGCNDQLLRYNKGTTAFMNEKIIKKLQQYNFELDYGFIMFDADTTIKELEENLDFIDRTGLRSSISRFTKKLRVTPHTVFYDQYHSRNLLLSELNIDQLYYEYTFCNPIIELVYSYIERLDNYILKESYQLQAIIRSTMIQSEKDIAYKRLIKLRDCEYIFLRKCVDCYKRKENLLKNDINIIYQTCLNNGGYYNIEYK